MKFVDVSAMNDEANAGEALQLAAQRSDYIQGNAVGQFEAAWSSFCDTQHCVAVGSGTDALILALTAMGIGPGDDVLVPTNTFIATVLAIAANGARPVFVDIHPMELNITPVTVSAALTPNTKAIVVVHLMGRPVHIEGIRAVLPGHVQVLEDAAQAHGASQLAGVAACHSFYPSKNLGALGDAGAVVTNDPELANSVRALANYGSYGPKHEYKVLGRNSRMDTLQASVLLAKLPLLKQWNAKRAMVAGWYCKALPPHVSIQTPHKDHVYHLFVIQTDRRDELQTYLGERGIPTGIHYPTPCHRQPLPFEQPEGTCPVAESVAKMLLSLPMCPSTTHEDVIRVASAITDFHR